MSVIANNVHPHLARCDYDGQDFHRGCSFPLEAIVAINGCRNFLARATTIHTPFLVNFRSLIPPESYNRIFRKRLQPFPPRTKSSIFLRRDFYLRGHGSFLIPGKISGDSDKQRLRAAFKLFALRARNNGDLLLPPPPRYFHARNFRSLDEQRALFAFVQQNATVEFHRANRAVRSISRVLPSASPESRKFMNTRASATKKSKRGPGKTRGLASFAGVMELRATTRTRTAILGATRFRRYDTNFYKLQRESGKESGRTDGERRRKRRRGEPPSKIICKREA